MLDQGCLFFVSQDINSLCYPDSNVSTESRCVQFFFSKFTMHLEDHVLVIISGNISNMDTSISLVFTFFFSRSKWRPRQAKTRNLDPKCKFGSRESDFLFYQFNVLYDLFIMLNVLSRHIKEIT